MFPDQAPPGRDERIARFWSLDRPLPVPVTMPDCPVCGGLLVFKDWRFHARKNTGSTAPWRCDVRLKCIDCSHVPQFGVAVPEPYYRAGCTHSEQWIGWREGKRILGE